MSLVFAMVLGRNFRSLKGVPAFQLSTFLEDSRSSPGALFLSEWAAGLSNSDDGFLNSGAEFDGEVSPDALLTPAWLSPLPFVSICHSVIQM
jgi:hypothetical protein